MLTAHQAIVWEKFQYAMGIMATSPKDASGRLPDVYDALTHSQEGINPKALPHVIQERYDDWLTSVAYSMDDLSINHAMSLCHVLWSIYQTFREEAEKGIDLEAQPITKEVPTISKEMAIARLNLVLKVADGLPLEAWQKTEVERCSFVLGIRMPNDEESLVGYVKYVLETVKL